MVTDSNDEMLTFIDHRIDTIKRYPLMWGSYEAVEMQLLLLLELRARIKWDELQPQSVAVSVDRTLSYEYGNFLAKAFPFSPKTTLAGLIEAEPCDRRDEAFVKKFTEFEERWDSVIAGRLPK